VLQVKQGHPHTYLILVRAVTVVLFCHLWFRQAHNSAAHRMSVATPSFPNTPPADDETEVDLEASLAQPTIVKQRAIDRNVKIVLAVLFYFGASMALVLLNKRMFSTLGKDFPLFVTWWQFVVALGMIAVGGEIGKVYPQVRKEMEGPLLSSIDLNDCILFCFVV
jgi:hypothetical protein